MLVPNMEFIQINKFFLFDKIIRIHKVARISRHWLLQYKCFIYSISKKWSSRIYQIQIPARFYPFFLAFEKIIVKFSVKIPWRFDIILHMCTIYLFIITIMTIAYKNYSKFCTKKSKKQHYVYFNYNNISIIYFNSNMVLMKVRNH